MANTKTAKVEAEIEKIKAKIGEFQTRLRELEQKRTEIENTEIVGMVRGLNVSMEDLAALMQTIREQKASAVDNLSRTEPTPEAPPVPDPVSTVQYNVGDTEKPRW